MANASIYAGFERMWQYLLAKVGTKADANHAHDDIYYTETEVDKKVDEVQAYVDTQIGDIGTILDEINS